MQYFQWNNKKKTKSETAKKKKKGVNLVAKLDRIFSKYIRLRDVMPNGYFICISCGRIKHISEGDCGHYYSRSHKSTRWDEDNAHLECERCNRYDSDHLLRYTKNLIKKIGLARVERLDWKHNQPKHWMDFEIEEMIKFYKRKYEEISKQKGIKL